MSLGLKKLIKEARDNGFNEQVNQALYNYLGSLGVTGALNDRLYKYLASKYGEGSLPTLLYKEGSNSLEQRYFTTFLASEQTYIRFPSVELPLTQPWEIVIETSVSTDGGYLVADKDSSDPVDRLGLYDTSDGRIFGLTTEGPTAGGDTSPYLGVDKLVKFNISTDATTIYYAVNGVTMHTRPVGTRSPIINSVGTPYAGTTGIPYLTGTVSRVKIAVDGQTHVDLRLDEDYNATNVVSDISGSGNDGTLYGVYSGMSKLYTQLPNGNWEDGQGGVLEVTY